MINDTVAQSSTDSSAIQIPNYFFLIINFLACFPHLLFIIFGLNTVSKDFLYVCMCTHVYICTYIKSDADGCMHHLFHAIQQSYKHVKKHDSVIRLTHFRHFLHVYQFSMGLYCT